MTWRLGLAREGLGQGMVEYGLIAALTAIFTVIILVVFGATLSEVLHWIADTIDASTLH